MHAELREVVGRGDTGVVAETTRGLVALERLLDELAVLVSRSQRRMTGVDAAVDHGPGERPAIDVEQLHCGVCFDREPRRRDRELNRAVPADQPEQRLPLAARLLRRWSVEALLEQLRRSCVDLFRARLSFLILEEEPAEHVDQPPDLRSELALLAAGDPTFEEAAVSRGRTATEDVLVPPPCERQRSGDELIQRELRDDVGVRRRDLRPRRSAMELRGELARRRAGVRSEQEVDPGAGLTAVGEPHVGHHRRVLRVPAPLTGPEDQLLNFVITERHFPLQPASREEPGMLRAVVRAPSFDRQPRES